MNLRLRSEPECGGSELSNLRVLGDYVELVRGKTYKGSLVGAPGPALLGLGSIVPGGGFRHDFKTYGGECPAELMLEPGDLYVSLKGATKDGEMIGSVARLPGSVPSGRLTQDTVRLVFRERNPAIENYVYWLLRTPAYRAYCAGRATGSAVVALSRSDFLSYPVPALTEARTRVVSVLEFLDDKIESNRRVVHQSLELLDALAEAHCSSVPTTPLGSLSGLTRETVSPAALGDAVVDHYSLPAFDSSGRPERVPASTIKSNKIGLSGTRLLVSRLNPRTSRTWWAVPNGASGALASPEFAVLSAPTDVELASIWLAVRHPLFLEELPRRATGTSGSHQRVRPDDMLAIVVPDVRQIDEAIKETSLNLLRVAHQRREESARLSDLRDSLLSELLSGGICVPEAADVVQDVVDESESA